MAEVGEEERIAVQLLDLAVVERWALEGAVAEAEVAVLAGFAVELDPDAVVRRATERDRVHPRAQRRDLVVARHLAQRHVAVPLPLIALLLRQRRYPPEATPIDSRPTA